MIPPVVKELTVATTPARAFEIFWSEIGAWWPLHTHSLSAATGQSARAIRFEPRLGGAITETTADGSEARWGEVTEWAPGRATAFTWQLSRPAAEATHVRITFAATEAGARVTLSHSGWEAMGEEAAKARGNYDSGWETVFVTRYGEACRRRASA